MGGTVLADTGATATIVLVNDGRIVTANIGDSSAVLSRKGAPITLSIAHRVGPGPLLAPQQHPPTSPCAVRAIAAAAAFARKKTYT
jgi:hypothetical protein